MVVIRVFIQGVRSRFGVHIGFIASLNTVTQPVAISVEGRRIRLTLVDRSVLVLVLLSVANPVTVRIKCTWIRYRRRIHVPCPPNFKPVWKPVLIGIHGRGVRTEQ